MKLNDYMTAGRPIVSTDVGDLPELVQKDGMGKTTETNPETFAQYTFELLGNEKSLLQLGVYAREAAE